MNSFQGYASDARDTKRINDISVLGSHVSEKLIK